MDFFQALDRQVGARLAIGAGFIGRNGATQQVAKALGLANGLSAGTAGLSDLPEESPKDQAKVPTAIAGMSFLILLSQSVTGQPGSEEGF
jgi:hypothetical protein